MEKDIQSVLISEEELKAKVKEIGAKISEDYAGKKKKKKRPERLRSTRTSARTSAERTSSSWRTSSIRASR